MKKLKPVNPITEIKLPIEWRSFSAFAYDIFAALISWILAYNLRFNFNIPSEFSLALQQIMLWAVPLQSVMFIAYGLYKGIWRFASLPDLKRILIAVFLGMLGVVAILIMLKPHGVVPRSVLILDPILLVLIMGGGRFAYRSWKEHTLYGSSQSQGEPVIILGAGEAAIALVKDLMRSEEWRVVGMLDDDVAIKGRYLLGVKVLGGITELPEIARSLNVSNVIVAMPSANHQARRKAVSLANFNHLTVLTVPAFDDLLSGKVTVSQIRRVEVEDLLGREPVHLNDDGLHAMIEGRVVMVTGAGGSIGAELCRQIIKYQPDLLICFDISEYALYAIEQEFKARFPQVQSIYVIGDVKNEKRLKLLLEKYQPSVVFHAAAYKHVPLMEQENVAAALANNVLGTYTLAKVCKELDVEKFVLISTDKAVNPTNVMGASKRLAEMVCQGLQDAQTARAINTRFVIVRFGNVLGSSGSVIPKFREQIAKGGPVTVTHPEITRYFMSIPEAAQLVMQAGLMGTGAEIFVLDMGEPVRIADLALDMIRLSGLNENEIEIQYTGLRPGEKLYEELLADDEHTLPTPHEKLRIAVARSADKAWVKALIKWVESTVSTDEPKIKEELKMWVEEYTGDINANQAESHKIDAMVQLAPRSSTLH
ncbi:polysaccharide biosynthesis protein [Methyloradius palustris]|uniref:Nucleoside-diphosphate sugar oxidoreductase n=1 Tax=Methyloradius palustris TaxID=2778876 RepID=A0A8D5JWN4_9PROT|nr:nucleoside-diphosphate sugar epimerase/dehydratase [Methyloradius palustris]BCM25274.1 nucleoside-diphosphate sugar oxidoreductase [Methyloradius palustris]